MKILIDNGHGENTPGKCSPDGRLKEWIYTREIADRIVTGLREKGFNAERIVKENIDIPLPSLKIQERVTKLLSLIDEKIRKNHQINDYLSYQFSMVA